ncbi:MAG: adenylyl-sulfate kinase [Bacteroidia bacterium]|nr:MAG: adenylyl-sulfate kinase [Bacteroidia bacterium]
MLKKVIWLFGLSGAGKSTIAQHISQLLSQKNITYVLLDGDEIRNTVNSDLGFSTDDRRENIRRSSEMAKLLSQQGIKCICSFITPTKELRDIVRKRLGNNVILFFIDTPIEECIKRDVKGLYKKAINQEVKNFTGISAAFEQPENENDVVRITTTGKTPDECAKEILDYILNKTCSNL